MEIVRRLARLRELSRDARADKRKLALVPTMGYLHEGHLSLVRLAREMADLVVVSVFVNPSQFGPGEDLESYPRDSHRDAELCKKEGTDVVYMPEASDVYPRGFQTWVEVEQITKSLCGAFRPGHFRGVTTIVLKLLNMVQPHFALFGQKDAQQCLVVERMIRDLNLDVELVIGPTVREPDGLAMSSRNKHLSADERRAAPAIYRALTTAERLYARGEREAARLLEAVRDGVEAEQLLKLQYVELVDTEALEPVERVVGRCLLALAAFAGETRLIDNTLLGEERRGE
jgi:pantoate--beta-alanine ligase